MKNISVGFEVGDRVHIEILKTWGRVTAIFINDGGITYQVRYFDHVTPKSEYFYADELKIVKDGTAS